MKAQHVPCNNCGASLKITSATNFLTCSYCGTSLKVQRNPESTFTEILKSLKKKTYEISSDLQIMKLKDELTALDNAWQIRRPQIMLAYSEQPTAPIPQLSKLLYVLASCLFLLLLLVAFLQNSVFYFIFGFCIALLLLAAGLDNDDKSKLYFPEKRAHEAERKQILDDLRSIYDARLA